MPIAFLCPHCGVKVFAPSAGAGKEGTCPHCNRDIIVPLVRRGPVKRPDLAPPPAETEPPLETEVVPAAEEAAAVSPPPAATARPATPAPAPAAPPMAGLAAVEEDIPVAALDREPLRGKLLVAGVVAVVLAGLAVGGYVLFGPSDEGGGTGGGGDISGDTGGGGSDVGGGKVPAPVGPEAFIGTWELVEVVPAKMAVFTKQHPEYRGVLTIEKDPGTAGDATEFIVTSGESKKKRSATWSNGALAYSNPIIQGSMSFRRDGDRLKLIWRLTDTNTIEAWYAPADVSETKVTRNVPLPSVAIASCERFLAQKTGPPTHYFMGKPMGGGAKFGFIDRSGKFVIDATLRLPTQFRDRRALVRDNSTTVVCIDESGREVFQGQSTTGSSGVSRGWVYADFSQELSRVGKVLLNSSGQATILYGYVGANGATVIQPKFGGAGNFSERLAPARLPAAGSKWGYIARSGAFTIPPQFDEQPGAFSEGLAAVKVGGRFGYIDKMGEIVVEPAYRSARPFRSGLARVGTPVGPAVIDRTGTVLLKPATGLDGDFHDGMARIEVDGKYGFMNNSLQVAVPPTYERAEEFSEGLAAVHVNGKWGYIDRSGKTVVPPAFRTVQPFYGGLALVNRPGGLPTASWKPDTGYIDRTGKFIWKFTGK